MGDSAEGVFRKPGSQEAARNLARAYAEGRAPWLREEDVDNIATMLKAYLRNLDEPILSFRLYPAFINVSRRIPSLGEEEIFDELHRVLSELPPLYFFTTWYLMRLLHRCVGGVTRCFSWDGEGGLKKSSQFLCTIPRELGRCASPMDSSLPAAPRISLPPPYLYENNSAGISKT